jgi:hypothetical protein
LRLAKKLVAIHGGEAQVPHQRQDLIALQAMLDLHEHLPQGLRVELRKHAAERVIAGRARSPDDVPPPLAIRLDRMQAGASRDQERGHALPDMGRRVQRDTSRVPQPRQESWQIEHLGRIPLKTTHHQR